MGEREPQNSFGISPHFIYEEMEAQRNGMTFSSITLNITVLCNVLNCVVRKKELSLSVNIVCVLVRDFISLYRFVYLEILCILK